MTNRTNNVFRTAVFTLVFAASFGVAEAQAQTFDPGSNHNDTAGSTATTSATEAGPSTTHPATIAPHQSFGQTANPSTDANESGPVENNCDYDMDGDGFVDFEDYITLLSIWARQSSSSTESSSDGATMVDFNAILGLLSAWGSC
jgi:hypothetical protein